MRPSMSSCVCPLCLQQAQGASQGFLAYVECQVCGKYRTTTTMVSQPKVVERDTEGRPHLLRGLVRRASDSGVILDVNEDTIKSLMDSGSFPKSPLDNLEHALLFVADHQERPDVVLVVNQSVNFPFAFARDSEEFIYYLETLEKQGYIEHDQYMALSDPPSYRLTPSGWSAVQELRRTSRRSNQAFVAMWFDDELNPAWTEGFRPALEATGYEPVRIDTVEHNQKIDDMIMAEIRRSSLLVADFTGNRGGVYFEAGFALGLGIRVIWTCRESDINNVHFDTRQYNHITWTSPEDINTKLRNRIEATNPARVIQPG